MPAAKTTTPYARDASKPTTIEAPASDPNATATRKASVSVLKGTRMRDQGHVELIAERPAAPGLADRDLAFHKPASASTTTARSRFMVPPRSMFRRPRARPRQARRARSERAWVAGQPYSRRAHGSIVGVHASRSAPLSSRAERAPINVIRDAFGHATLRHSPRAAQAYAHWRPAAERGNAHSCGEDARSGTTSSRGGRDRSSQM